MQDDLDSLGFAASKLWNVARWTSGRVWNETGHIPEDSELKSYLKSHERYDDLHSQSSQRVLEELSSVQQLVRETPKWGHESESTSIPYRKHNDEHPRSTLTFKGAGFKFDTNNGRVRLSKGENLKEYWTDFALCDIQTRSDVDLSAIESVQQNRFVLSGTSNEIKMSGNSTSSAILKLLCQRTTRRKPLVLTLESVTSLPSPLKTKSPNYTR